MTATFKPGDKVEHRSWGPGEIAFGPFEHTNGPDHYLMKSEGEGRHSLVLAEALTPAAKFKVGDVAKGRVTGRDLKIIGGPYSRRNGVTWFTVEYPEGHHGDEDARNLLVKNPADEPIKVGDVIRILKDGAFRADVKAGDLFVVESFTGYNARIRVDGGPGARMSKWVFRPQDFERVSPDDVAVHDGVAYDVPAKYRDTDGDVWTLARFGDNVRGGLGHTPTSAQSGDALDYIVRNYGPLRKV